MARPEAVTAVMEGYRPVFRNSADKVAFAVHGVFLHNTGASAAANWNIDFEPSLTAEINNWNELDGRYFFVYFHRWIPTIKIFVKMVSRDGKMQIYVQALKGSQPKPSQLEIEIGRYLPVNKQVDSNYRNYRNWKELVGCVEKEVIDPYNPYPAEEGHESALDGDVAESPAGHWAVYDPYDGVSYLRTGAGTISETQGGSSHPLEH